MEKINHKVLDKELNSTIFLKNQFKNQKYGKKPVFGLMPDWNPVEMIGNFPSPLSYSLYSELITNESWAIARKEMKYKFVKSNLMFLFSGRPFIDARLSFILYLKN